MAERDVGKQLQAILGTLEALLLANNAISKQQGELLDWQQKLHDSIAGENKSRTLTAQNFNSNPHASSIDASETLHAQASRDVIGPVISKEYSGVRPGSPAHALLYSALNSGIEAPQLPALSAGARVPSKLMSSRNEGEGSDMVSPFTSPLSSPRAGDPYLRRTSLGSVLAMPSRRQSLDSAGLDAVGVELLPTRPHPGKGSLVLSSSITGSMRSDGSNLSMPNGAIGLNWPENVRIRTGTCLGPVTDPSKGFVHAAGLDQSMSSLGWSDALYSSHGFLSRGTLMFDPHSKMRTLVEVISCLFLLYNAVVAPCILAFNVHSVEDCVVHFVECTFWSVHILGQFTFPYLEHGVVVHLPKRIAKKYLSTWFPFDMLMLVCSWCSASLGGCRCIFTGCTATRQGTLANIGSTLRAIAIIRTARFVPFLENIFSKFRVQLQDWALFMLFLKVGHLVGMMLWLNHVLSCAWLAIGRVSPTDTGMHWLRMEGEHCDISKATCTYEDESTAFQYFTSLHWSFTQMTPGSMEVTPTSTWERVFNVFCLVIGALFGSTLVSSLSAMMIKWQMMKMDRVSKVNLVCKFLRQHEVHSQLAVQVENQVNQRLTHSKQLTFQDVPELELLSSTLRESMFVEIFGRHISAYPLFGLWFVVDKPVYQDLCCKAIDYSYHSTSDYLFEPKIESENMYRLVSGRMSYTHYPPRERRSQLRRGSSVSQMNAQELNKGDFLAEGALWTHWVHVGRAECHSSCQMAVISAEAMWRALTHHPLAKNIAEEYGTKFHTCVVTGSPPVAQYPTDLVVQFASHKDVFFAVSSEIRTALARVAHARLSGQWIGSKRGLDDMMEEVSEGKCILLEEGRRDIVRVEAAVAIRLATADGLVLCQIGQKVAGEVSIKFGLPSTKVRGGETPHDAMRRLMDVKMDLWRSSMDFRKPPDQEVIGGSMSSHVRPQSLRTVFYAEYEPDADELNGDAAFGVFSEAFKTSPDNTLVTDRFRTSPDTTAATERMTPAQSGTKSGTPGTSMATSCLHKSFAGFVAWPVVVVRNYKQCNFFAWVPEEDFEMMLELPSGHKSFTEWIQFIEDGEVSTIVEHVS